jgi:hypothetical protein
VTDAAHELGGLYALRAGVNGALERLGDEGMRAQVATTRQMRGLRLAVIC